MWLSNSLIKSELKLQLFYREIYSNMSLALAINKLDENVKLIKQMFIENQNQIQQTDNNKTD